MFGTAGKWCQIWCIFPVAYFCTSEFAEKRESWKQLALAWSRRKTISYNFIHPQSECFMILVTQRLAGRFTGSTSLLPSRADLGPFMNSYGPSSTVWLRMTQWIHMRNWNWEADQGCKPWSHLLHAFELLPKGCHVASALKHMFHWVVCWVPIWVHRRMHQSNKESFKTFQDYALCSLNRITAMRYVQLYMIMNLWCLKNWVHAMCKKLGCRGICLIQFHLETSLAVVTSGSLAAHPKCPALGACLAHAWDTMILSQIQKKYPGMKIENWRNLMKPGNVW